ncbi:alpha/beta hydrolase family protein [Cellulomonas fengjieae]|uniref:Dienelactone hydrolase n=1 Tax=Cellulomonas fengjieae TaxID=2819978 RepID=A0ABS3SDX7_9CELL|nr:alpha/beta family hydrolase [Cellulomonas fengjieae]MBO3083165.1 dienelactone hydrolase [Cellulomonas fengjieae]MBO3102088.1 dienelactone hydrolase [Cellulomonas fengjieae]QVI65474.1 dienelactone hydrolase [Cellulomonas fengjieae]
MSVAGLLLTPGFGGSRDSAPLVAVESAVAPLPVRRIDLPKTAGPAVAEVRAQAEAFASSLGVGTDALVLGGRSFGGRMCSMAVAAGMPAAGLVLLSYPLHPPGRPDQLRIAHLPDLRVPVLAVSGTTDPFGSPEELTAHLSVVPGPLTTVFLPGPHLPTSTAAVAEAVRDWLATMG